MSGTRLDAVARLLRDLDEARPGDGEQYLIEHLAAWGPAGLDVQAVARGILDRREQDA